MSAQRDRSFVQWSVRVFIMTLGVFAAAGCGKDKGKALKAEFSVNPPTPVVITAPTKDSSGEEVKGPWFLFSINMANNTGEDVRILAFELKIKVPNSLETVEVALSPTEFNYSTDQGECNFTSFGQWAPGENRPLNLTNNNPTLCGTFVVPQFYIGNLPRPANGRFNYRVEATAIGWFGTATAASGRFERKFFFSTE
jgi:hypothetical protein